MKNRKLSEMLSAILLIGAMLLSSCGVEKNETSDNSDNNISEQSIETSDMSDDVSESTTEPDEPERNYTLISRGKSYKTSVSANDHYPDMFGQQMTDGQKIPDAGSFYRDVRMVGYTSNARFDIDLGDDGKRISAIVARSLDIEQDGVLMASSALFYGSDDGKSWTSLGRKTFASNGTKTMGIARLELDEVVDYRYIRVSIMLRSGSAFFFTDEIEIYADIPAKESTTAALDAAYAAEDIDRNEWKDLSTGKLASPAAISNVAQGTKYSFGDAEKDERAKIAHDTAKLIPVNTVNLPYESVLTDGARTGRLFGDRVWDGISAKKASELVVDLEKIYDDLFTFRVYMLAQGQDIEFPDYIDVYGSDKGKNYTLLGRMYAPVGDENFAFTLILPEYIHARYIKFAFPAGNTNYWLEEVEIYSGLDEVCEDEYYPRVTYPKVTEELFWNTSEKDYSTVQNLLLGRIQQVAVSYYMDTSRGNLSPTETAWDSPILTDGKLAKNNYCYGGEWFYHRGGGAIEFFFDLEKLSTVNSVTVRYQEYLDWGINHPKYVTVFLSDDATEWYPVETREFTYEASRTFARNAAEFVFDKPYRARFIRIRYESAVLFIEEIEAQGTKQVTNDAIKLSESGIKSVVYYTNEEDYQYATTENTPVSAQDIAIVYGNHGDKSDLLPLVAYLDENGNITDTMMDGFIYCPTGIMPSGVGAHEGTVKKDWDYMWDQIFNGSAGFDTLEETVGDVKEALNIPDYKVQVYITIICPSEKTTDFGDIDGDGISEDLSFAENRRKVLNWYIFLCQSMFADRDYRNLELGGFYWISESINFYNDDSAIIREIADAVHDAGSYLLWIPYYNAHRYYLGYELGFDLICMQPNYAFNLEKGLESFTATARRMQTGKMCIEIENSYQSLADPAYARNYMLYLYYGATTGYMKNTVHIYYDDIDNYAVMAYSDSALCRMQYDSTYKFIKGTLEITPETIADITVKASKNSVLYGSVANGEEFASYSIATAPKHGYVSVSADGSFAYFPDKDYTGTDSFTYTYNEFLGESEPCTVIITVS